MESLNKNQYCPVCGYNLGFAAWDNDSASHEICPCCGIQYGYDDMGGGDLKKRHEIYENWKKKWIHEGMHWDGIDIAPPDNWDPIEQLKKLED